jgi:hypothetical protein
MEPNMIEATTFRDLGRQATEKVASKVNAGNANSFAASSLAHELQRAMGNARDVEGLLRAIARVQQRAEISLFEIIDLSPEDQAKACASFCAGCYEWAAENPD